MNKNNYLPEQIIIHLREVEVLCSQGITIAEAARQIGVTEQTYYRWRKQYVGMTVTDAKRLRTWLGDIGVSTAYIELGSPWVNGYCESFNGKVRDEFLNREIFDNIFEVEVSIRKWVLEYNTIRPYSSLGHRPPAPQAILIAP